MSERALLPASSYVDPAWYELERDRVFAREWLVLAALAALPDGHAVGLVVAGHPIALRREGDRVFGVVNVCRHRGGPLAWEGAPEPCARWRCKYHGWQYDADGRLLRAPHFGADPPDARLTLVHVRVWGGLVFGCLAADPPPFEPLVDELAAASGGLDGSGFEVHRTASHTLACNWKTYAENYMEGYHIPFLHPSLSKEVELRDYQVQPGRRVVLHVVPAGPEGVYDGLWAFVWPNTAINVYQGGLSLERIVPTGPGTLRIDYTYLFDPAVSAEVRDRSAAMSTVVTEEDRQICEALQVNLASGRYAPGWLSPRHEQGLLTFQQWVVEAMR